MSGFAEVKEEEVVKHWGLKSGTNWFVDSDGVIINFSCPRVANVQKEIMDHAYAELGEPMEVRVEEIK
jgi:hypothetical protein